MTIGKTIALAIRAFVGKVMSLLFNTLSRLVIAFLPKSKHLLILWLQSQSAVIFTVSTSICYEVMEPDAMIPLIHYLFMKNNPKEKKDRLYCVT